jgi:hypothetical protein
MEIIGQVFKKERKYKFLQKTELKFKEDGTFKIVQLSDLHEFKDSNRKTMKLMDNILEEEKPDLVVISGDCIQGYFCRSKEAAKKAIDNIAQSIEKRKIPWIVALGNHDCEFSSANRKYQMKAYMSYTHNLSQCHSAAIGKAGDYNVLIKDSKGKKPVFNIFMMDSGDYSFRGYGYIKKVQVYWYELVSNLLEKKYGYKIPSFMFFHIPLQQQKIVGENKYEGDRFEKECVQGKDKGLFNAMRKMKNVVGVFCGHDHTNNYFGTLNEITLGYGGFIGYNAPAEEGAKRGARIFVLDEKDISKFKTYFRYE